VGESTAAGLLQGCELGLSWRGQPAWRVLDTCFHHGQRFWESLRHWRADPQGPRLLHFVGMTDHPPAALDLRRAALAEQLDDADEWLGQWLGLLPGFHRFSLHQGRVLLTLCVGQATQSLRELRFQADTLLLHAAPEQCLSEAGWDLWQVKALARCARRGSRLAIAADHARALLPALRQCGFELDPAPADAAVCLATFQPSWVIKTTRQSHPAAPQGPGDCVVLGAGLAGASVAAALARRGWQVQVLDQAAAPASGASSLPAGLLVPHVSADDCALSRLSRAGMRLTLQQAEALLARGRDWDATGVLQRDLGAGSRLPKSWPEQGLAWSSPQLPVSDAPWQQGWSASTANLWHGMAAWIKPAALVQAWLASPGVRFVGGVQVTGLRRHLDAWELLGADHRTLLATRRLVLAHAHGVQHLLQGCTDVADLQNSALASLHPVPGQVSWGLRQDGQTQALPPFPVNGGGSLLPAVPLTQGMAWLAGATYDAAGTQPPDWQQGHSKNLSRLTQLLPAAAAALAPDFAQHRVQSWHNARCVSADRLPLVGPVHAGQDDGLWVCTGLGSRGLSFAVLCAELLAARWGAEPWPLPASLARAFEPRRGRTGAAASAL
jgi:tRNA 5-methylaminomethyl-2-thiouridine biosynthesis bifunctional protein